MFARVKLATPVLVNCQDYSKYYGHSDRFGYGIGQRVGVPEGAEQRVPGVPVVRIALFSERSSDLRRWATEENWREATRVHKQAYFTRTENLVQEEMLQRIRAHYVSQPYATDVPVEAGLFRFEGAAEFGRLLGSTVVGQLPSVVFGPMKEDTEQCIVDFANKRLGGGWLGYGMVQEEKMFIERFDLGALAAKSLLEMPDPTQQPLASPFSMTPTEAYVLRGAPAWAHLDFYGRTTAEHAQKRVTLLDPAADRRTAPTIVAIDAIKASFERYEREHLDMMLVKAFTGFAAARHDPQLGGQQVIASGSWGCGAFLNNERVMFVIQTLAANLAGVQLVYHVLGDGYNLAPAFAFLEEALRQKRTVADTMTLLADLCATESDWQAKPPRQRL